MHYLRAFFVVLGAVDAHPMKVQRRGHHGATYPRGIFAIWWCGDPDLRAGQPFIDHRLQSFGKSREQRVAAGQQDVIIQVVSFVNIAISDRRLYQAVDAILNVHARVFDQSGVEQRFRASDAKDFEENIL